MVQRTTMCFHLMDTPISAVKFQGHVQRDEFRCAIVLEAGICGLHKHCASELC